MPFFTPTGPVFHFFYPDVLPFAVCAFTVCTRWCVCMCCRCWCSRSLVACLWSRCWCWSGRVRCWLRDRFAWSCVSGVLLLLAPHDRVSGSCGLGRTLGARSGRDNNRITLTLILWKNTILTHWLTWLTVMTTYTGRTSRVRTGTGERSNTSLTLSNTPWILFAIRAHYDVI